MTVTAIKMDKARGLAPFSLKDAPSFIEAQFPVGRLSAEAYKERKAGAGSDSNGPRVLLERPQALDLVPGGRARRASSRDP